MALKPVLAYVAALISLVSMTKAITTGFTIDITHRDSLQSPLHNPSLSPLQRRLGAIQRSFNRVQLYNSKLSRVSQITATAGEYLMRFSVGTPSVPSLAIVDTGSDLTWIQIRPCIPCFNQTFPIFTPKKSSTYKRIPCIAPICTSLVNITFCSESEKNCLYSEGFGDGSFTQGELSTDTISFPSSDGKTVIRAPNIVIGCGFMNGGYFPGGESGIVGLGGGNLSLVQQLGEGKFSYCLVKQSVMDNNNTKISSGTLSFGDMARVSGKGVVSTPLVTKEPSTYYFLTLEGISVGNRKVGLENPVFPKEGNMIIDSGTTLTFLPQSLYTILAKAMSSSIELERVKDPMGELDLCFLTRSDDIKFPPVVFNFKGANVNLSGDNVFVRTSDVSLCLAAVPGPEQEFGIYGNIAQINFLVGYDLEKRAVFFKPADCGKN